MSAEQFDDKPAALSSLLSKDVIHLPLWCQKMPINRPAEQFETGPITGRFNSKARALDTLITTQKLTPRIYEYITMRPEFNDVVEYHLIHNLSRAEAMGICSGVVGTKLDKTPLWQDMLEKADGPVANAALSILSKCADNGGMPKGDMGFIRQMLPDSFFHERQGELSAIILKQCDRDGRATSGFTKQHTTHEPQVQ